MTYVGVKTNSHHYDDGYFGSGKYIKRAIQKYGIENFTKRVLDHGTAEQCFRIESEIVNDTFIKRKDTYNISLGGRGGNLGEKVNRKKSLSLKGHVISEETKAKISKAHKGKKGNRKGAKHTDEAKAKLSASIAAKGGHGGTNNANSRIFKITSPEGVEYIVNGGMKKFCEKHNLTFSSMSSIANGNLKPSGKHTGWSIERVKIKCS